MSTKISRHLKERVDIVSRQHWKDAIIYGERLLATAKGKRRRARLGAAIERFKLRLNAGAPYPGLPLD
jgi:hypothetical protein